MDGVRACRLLKHPPGMVGTLEIDGLLALKPQCHLFNVLIVFVARMIGILSIVNV